MRLARSVDERILVLAPSHIRPNDSFRWLVYEQVNLTMNNSKIMAYIKKRATSCKTNLNTVLFGEISVVKVV